MKLEVGMYVRTKRGIAKVKSMYVEPNQYIVYTDKDITFEYYLNNAGEWVADYCYGYSSNIIDLIEEHDYIRIITSAYFEPVYYSYGKLVIRDDIDISKYTNKFIAEVITKEQFESMSYKVGEING